MDGPEVRPMVEQLVDTIITLPYKIKVCKGVKKQGAQTPPITEVCIYPLAGGSPWLTLDRRYQSMLLEH
jgi:hypothetical protein